MDLAHTIEELSVQVVGFLALFLILKRVAWRPLLQALDARRAHIEEEVRKASQRNEELARLHQDLNRRLSTIDDEARTKIQQAIQDGRRMAMEIQEDARAKAQQILTKSQETIALELAKAKVSLRDELADMTIAAVERLLKEKLDAKTDQQLVASILDELGQAPTKA